MAEAYLFKYFPHLVAEYDPTDPLGLNSLEPTTPPKNEYELAAKAAQKQSTSKSLEKEGGKKRKSEATFTIPNKLKLKIDPNTVRAVNKAINQSNKSIEEAKTKAIKEKSAAANKLLELSSDSDDNSDDPFSNFNPIIDNQIFVDLEKLSTEQNELKEQLNIDLKEKQQKKLSKINSITLNILRGTSNAEKATIYNKNLLTQVQKIINTTLHTNSGKDRLVLCIDKLINNYEHHDRYLQGVNRCAKDIRKILEIPAVEE